MKFVITVFLILTATFARAQKVIIGKVFQYKDSDTALYDPVPYAKIISETDTFTTDSVGGFMIEVNNKTTQLLFIASGMENTLVSLRQDNGLMTNIIMHPIAQSTAIDDRLTKNILHPDSVKDEVNDTTAFSGVLNKINAVVIDAESGERLPGVSVYIKNDETGAMTDSNGFFQILYNGTDRSVNISALGYTDIDTTFYGSFIDTLFIKISAFAQDLDEVLVLARRKGRYKNKNNPAVELIKKVIDHKSNNREPNSKFFQYELYDKMTLSVSNLPGFFKKSFLFRKFNFLFRNEDTSKISGRRLLPLFVSESISNNYENNELHKKAQTITSEKRMRFSGDLVESNNVSAFLDRLYEDVNIYDNKIRILNNYFLSPIADVAPAFYKFYIMDTTVVNGQQIVQLEFEPRNKEDFGFEGRMYVTLTPRYAVTYVTLAVPKEINLNWTNALNIALSFEQQPDGRYLQDQSRYFVDFGLFKSKRGVVGDRLLVRSKFDTLSAIPDSFFVEKQVALETAKDTALQRKDSFWVAVRPQPLSIFEYRAYKNIDSLRNMPAYKNLMEWGYFFATGYRNFKTFELGNLYDFYSANVVEGSKLRLSARTNIKKWQRFLVQSYIAYGFKDQRWKYYLEGTYALNNKYIFGFPMHYLRVSYQYDTRAPGQTFGFNTQENSLTAAKRSVNQSLTYNSLFGVKYVKEFQNHMTATLNYTWWKQEAAGNLYYVRADGSNDTINTIKTNELSLEWRWAPNEKFYQNKRYRTQVNNNNWELGLKLTAGFNNGLSKNIIPYQRLDLSVLKRLQLTPFGYVDAHLAGGYLKGEVPYPLLYMPPANLSYWFNIGSYNMMNYMEFAMDKYISLSLDYHMQGFVLNKIPLLKKLRLREVFSLNTIYGGLRSNNMPENNSQLLLFPVNSDGSRIVHTFSNAPYIEVSAGVENILGFLRIDFVRRLNYIYAPRISPYGLRFSFAFGY